MGMAKRGKTRKRKYPGWIRKIVAQNVRALMDKKYAAERNRPGKLSQDAKVSLSTIQRLLSEDVGASIDTIESVARILKVPPFQLLMPSEEMQRAISAQVVAGAVEDNMPMDGPEGRPKSPFKVPRGAPGINAHELEQ